MGGSLGGGQPGCCGQGASGSSLLSHLTHYSRAPTAPCSSNVVEKCLKLGGAGLNEQRDAVVAELMNSQSLGRLLQVGVVCGGVSGSGSGV